MTVTEIALLHLSPNVAIDDTNLYSKLAQAKIVMQDYTGRMFYYLQQMEDPMNIYIVGEWDSLEQHMNEFIPSAKNQMLLESLKGLLSVEWLLHIDASHADLPLSEADPSKQASMVYAIVRHFIKSGEKQKFLQTFDTEMYHLQDFVTEGKIGRGWRIDKVDDQDEWVLCTPWTSVEQHYAFAETEGFAKYGKIRGHLEGAEIRHARMLDI